MESIHASTTHMATTDPHTTLDPERGQAAVEFAMALPILCMLLVGIISYGQMIWTSMDLTSATRDGARRAAAARADTSVAPETQVRTVLRNSLDRTNPDDVAVTVSGGWERDARVTVRSSLPYELDVMGIVVWSGNLNAESQVRIG